MEKCKRIEFSSSPEGRVMVMTDNDVFLLEEKHQELLQLIAKSISIQYPEAWKALGINYKSCEKNTWHYLYKRVSRFILCNMGKMDGLSFDFDNGILHLEDIQCPIRCECSFFGIICHPKPLDLDKRELKMLTLWKQGETYKEISDSMNVGQSSVKNTIHNITKRMKLGCAKDLMKLAAAIL